MARQRSFQTKPIETALAASRYYTGRQSLPNRRNGISLAAARVLAALLMCCSIMATDSAIADQDAKFPVVADGHEFTAEQADEVIRLTQFVAGQSFTEQEIRNLRLALARDFAAEPATSSKALAGVAQVSARLAQTTSPFYRRKIRDALYTIFYFDAAANESGKVSRDLIVHYAPVIAAEPESRIVVGEPLLDLSVEIETYVRRIIGAEAGDYGETERARARKQIADQFETLADKRIYNQLNLLWDSALSYMEKHGTERERRAVAAAMVEAYQAAGETDAGVEQATGVLLRAGGTFYKQLLVGLAQSEAGIAQAINNSVSSHISNMGQIDRTLGELSRHTQIQAETLPCSINPNCDWKLVETPEY